MTSSLLLNMADKLKNISVFSSSLRDPGLWMDQFIASCTAFGIEDAVKVPTFVAYCDPDAYATLNGYGAFAQGASLGSIKTRIVKIWGPPSDASSLAAEVEHRRQGPSEPFTEYAADMVRLIKRTPAANLDSYVERLKLNMRDDLAEALDASSAKTWDEVVEMVRRVEASRARRVASKAAAPAAQAQAAVPTPDLAAFVPRDRDRDRDRDRSQPRSRLTCHRCGKAGHVARVCRAPAPLPSNSYSKYKTISTCHLVGVVQTSGPWTDVSVAGTACRALVDTGAAMSLVSSSLVRRLRRQPSRQQAKLVSVDGSPLSSTGQVDLPVALDGQEVTQRFVVMDKLATDLILGMDFLGSNGARLDAGAGTLSLPLKSAATVERQLDGAAQNISSAAKSPQVPIGSLVPHVSLQTLLLKYQQCFAADADEFGNARVDPLRFKVSSDVLVRSYPYRLSRPDAQFVEETVIKWLEAGRIRRSSSEFASPAHVVPKEDNGKRLVIDFSRLNSFIQADNQPAPRARDIFDALAGCKVFSKFDFQSAYLQIPVAEECRKFLSFVTESGQYEFNFVPFGLNISGNKLQRELNSLFAGIRGVYGYADDWLIATPSAEEHMLVLAEFLRRVAASGFILKPSKCVIGVPFTKFLGRYISSDGIRMDPEDADTIKTWPRPASAKELQRFLGLGRWCADFAPGYATAVQPLHRLASPSSTFKWTTEADQAFAAAKQRIGEALVLSFPDFRRRFTLETDASATGFGAVLRQGGRVVRIAHRATTPAESALPATLLELAALCWAVKYFHVYLHGSEFAVVTDHRALEWLRGNKHPTGKLALWALTLSDYRFTVEYRPGRDNTAADALSRITATVSDALPSHVDFVQAQSNDPTCMDIKRWLADGDLRASKGFVMDPSGILCTHATRYGLPVLKPLVPKTLVHRVLLHVHEQAAHLSGETVRLAKSLYHWGSVAKDAEAFAAECLRCQQSKSPRGPRNLPAGTISATRPFEIVAMDILGGLPASSGFQYILVMSDYFSRYGMAVPLRDKSCACVTEAFRDHWMASFGPPEALLTDQGGEFSGHELRQLLQPYRIDRRFTTAYHPQTDGVVERLNQTLIQILLTSLKDKSDWPTALPEALRAFNAAQSSSTGFPPYFLLFRRPPPAPSVLPPARPTAADTESLSKEADAARRAVTELNQERQRARDTANDSHTLQFKVGDLVMAKDRRIRQQPFSKLDRQWVGPCRVLQVKSRLNYVVKQLLPSRNGNIFVRTVNIADLKPFHGTPPTQPAPTQPPVPASMPSHPTLSQQPRPPLPPVGDAPRPVEHRSVTRTTPATAPTTSFPSRTNPTTAPASLLPSPTRPAPPQVPAQSPPRAQTPANPALLQSRSSVRSLRSDPKRTTFFDQPS